MKLGISLKRTTVCLIFASFGFSTQGLGSGRDGIIPDPFSDDYFKDTWGRIKTGFKSPSPVRLPNHQGADPRTTTTAPYNGPTWNDVKFNNPSDPFNPFGPPRNNPIRPTAPVPRAPTADENRLKAQANMATARECDRECELSRAKAETKILTDSLAQDSQRRKARQLEDAKIKSEIDHRVNEAKGFDDYFCFPGDTPVLVKDDSEAGLHSQAISTIKVGDFVVTCDLVLEGGRCQFGEVEGVIVRKASHLVELTFSEGIVQATGNHPFYAADKGTFVEAQELQAGDHLLHASGEIIEIQGKRAIDGDFTVYNLNVKGFHNYYASSILVHNCNALAQRRKGAVAPVVAGTLGAALLEGGGIGAEIGSLGGPGGAAVGLGVGLVGGYAVHKASEFIGNVFAEAESGTQDGEVGVQEKADSTGENLAEGGGAKVPVGRRGNPIEVKPGTNAPTEIGGRKYTGHSLDRMQGRGVPPSAVEEAIKNGVSKPGKEAGTIEHNLPEIKVITNIKGDVITVFPR